MIENRHRQSDSEQLWYAAETTSSDRSAAERVPAAQIQSTFGSWLMTIPRLTSPLQERFASLAETAMGVHYVLASYAQYQRVEGFIVLAATYFIPIHPYASLTSVAELHETTDLDKEGDTEPTSSFEIHQTFADKQRDARFLMFAELRRLAFGTFVSGSAPLPPPGSPLVLRTITDGSDSFLRFSYSAQDPRTQSGTVHAGTYATTYRDGSTVNSGFAAVARYALPVPLAAKYLTLLTPPSGTEVHLGASGPLFGQSGGGVEAFFPKRFKKVSRPFTIPAY